LRTRSGLTSPQSPPPEPSTGPVAITGAPSRQHRARTTPRRSEECNGGLGNAFTHTRWRGGPPRPAGLGCCWSTPKGITNGPVRPFPAEALDEDLETATQGLAAIGRRGRCSGPRWSGTLQWSLVVQRGRCRLETEGADVDFGLLQLALRTAPGIALRPAGLGRRPVGAARVDFQWGTFCGLR
jgi:hypothetical protein